MTDSLRAFKIIYHCVGVGVGVFGVCLVCGAVHVWRQRTSLWSLLEDLTGQGSTQLLSYLTAPSGPLHALCSGFWAGNSHPWPARVFQGITAAVGAKTQHCSDISRPHREGADYACITLMVAWLVWRGPQTPRQLQPTACGHCSYPELAAGSSPTL